MKTNEVHAQAYLLAARAKFIRAIAHIISVIAGVLLIVWALSTDGCSTDIIASPKQPAPPSSVVPDPSLTIPLPIRFRPLFRSPYNPL